MFKNVNLKRNEDSTGGGNAPTEPVGGYKGKYRPSAGKGKGG